MKNMVWKFGNIFRRKDKRQNTLSEPPERVATRPSLNEAGTKDFLRERAVRPFSDEWEEGQALLYVIPQAQRNYSVRMPDGSKRLPEKVASIARIDTPTDFIVSHRANPEGHIVATRGKLRTAIL